MTFSAEEGNDPDAMSLVAESCFHGISGFSRSPSEALRWWRRAADGGNADAAVSAGALLFQGAPGVLEDKSAAFQMYQVGGEVRVGEGN